MFLRKHNRIDILTDYLPILVNQEIIERTFEAAQALKSNYPVLAVVTGTKPDFYKQAPLIEEALNEDLPAFVIDTGQHYDELLGHGLEEFGIDSSIPNSSNP